MKWLCVPYVTMIIWRSFWPSSYTDRLVYWDVWMSAPFVGRTLATIGEVCWASQVGLAMLRANEELNTLSNRDNSYITNVITWLSL